MARFPPIQTERRCPAAYVPIIDARRGILDTNPGKCLGDLSGRWREFPQRLVKHRIGVQSARGTTDNPAFGEALEGLVDRKIASQIKKMAWSEDPTPLLPINPAKYFIFNRLHHMIVSNSFSNTDILWEFSRG